MKKILYIILPVILIVISYFVVAGIYPKATGRFPVFVVLFLLDIYLFIALKHKVKTCHTWKRRLLGIAYWSPLLVLASFIFSNLFLPYSEWNKSIRAYMMGFVIISYTSKMVVATFFIISDIIKYVSLLLKKNKEEPEEHVGETITRGAFIKKVGLVTGGLLFGTLLTGMFRWVYDFNIIKTKVKIPNLPESFNGLRIVQLADMHLGNWLSEDELKEAVRMINDLKPDLFFFTGDLVNYRTDEAFEYEHILKQIDAKYGSYSVLGNHDYGDYSTWPSDAAKEENMIQMYDLNKRLGWNLLLNENEIITKGDDSIAIIGVQNWGSYARFQRFGDLNEAVQGAEDVPVKILLSHDPTHWQYKVRQSDIHIDLTLAGHTHGGQFGFEIKGVRWSPAQYAYKYWAGLYSDKKASPGKPKYLYVNRGLGVVGYPGRVGMKPEITVIELYG
jgi:predicted MPP superfamily phosphohydrolase